MSAKRTESMNDTGEIVPLKKQKVFEGPEIGKGEMLRIEPILPEVYTQEVKLVAAVVCPILNKKDTSRIVKEFSSKLHFSEYEHLKRVKSQASKDDPLMLFVCPLSSITASEAVTTIEESMLWDYLKEKDITSSGLGVPTVLQVPKYVPLTRAQFSAGKVYWPTAFHEDKDIAKKIAGNFFSEEEKRKIQSHMTTAWDMAEKGGDNGGITSGACVVNPETNEIVAAVYDMRHSHPLHHTTMVAVEVVAKSQHGDIQGVPEDFRVESLSSQVDVESKTGPYLCTGYDLFITSEPCPMCAMALVHSRIRRVFFSKPSTDGALGSRYKIHIQEGLNHHFDVFRVDVL